MRQPARQAGPPWAEVVSPIFALLVARGVTVARAVPPYLRSVHTPRACHVMFMVYVRTWGRGRVRACRVVGLPRGPDGCLSVCAPHECTLGGPRAEAHIGVLSGRCPPPRANAGGRGMSPLCRGFGSVPGGGPPPAHTTHTGGRPCRVGQAGWGAPVVTCAVSLLYPLCR